jgi:signal transduction histidine kinase
MTLVGGNGSKIAAMTGAANSRLRAVLALGFGGLLALLVYSGASALQTLRQLHETEETVRASSLERRRVLATVVLSANIYTDHIEEVLLSYKTPDAPDVAGATSKRAEAARAALQAYPGDRTPEEQTLCEQLQAFLIEEDSLMRTAGAWTPAERRGRAQQLVSDEILPRKQRFVTIVQRMELLNDNQAAAASRSTFLQFSGFQKRLTKSLILMLASGLLLAIGSALYILRLERQARVRYAELAVHRSELQQLSARLVDAQESERRSISRELHDEVGQVLGLLLMDVGRLSNQLAIDDEKSRELVGHIKGVAERTVQTVRNMALLLRPSMLDDLGLVPAVEWYARELSRRGDIEVKVHAENISEHVPDEVKVCLYRVIQEASNNAQRHAHAKNVLVELMQSDDAIHLTITDDGSGFDAKRTRGMGLLGMEERVKRLGGTIALDSRANVGTTIHVVLPLAAGSVAGNP